MKLYYSNGACSLVPRIIINELKLPCTFVAVNLKESPKKTQEGDIFATITPKDAVPVLQTDDGQILTENAVILQYLADTAKATQLLPPIGDFNRYRVLEWVNFIATDLHKGVGALFNPKLTQQMKDEVTLPIIQRKLSFVNDALQNKKYLMGDHFTLPDAYLFVILTWCIHFKIDLSQMPSLEKYFLNLQTVPAVRKSLEEEGFLRKAQA